MASAGYPRDTRFTLDATVNPSHDSVVVLRHNLDRLAARRNQQRLWQALAQSAVWGVGAATLLVLAYRCYLLDGEWWEPLLIIGAALIIGYRNGLLRRSGAFDAALDADRSLDLQERLSSAFAFIQPDAVRRRNQSPTHANIFARLGAAILPRVSYVTSATPLTTHLVPALVQDAAARSMELDPKKLYPTRLDRNAKLLLLFSLLLAIFCLMPNIEWFRTAQQRHIASILQQQGKQLEAIAKVVHNRKDDKDPETKDLAKRLSALARKLQRGRMTKKTALVEMGQLHKDLEKAAQNGQKSNSTSSEQMQEELRNMQMQTPEGQQMKQELERKNFEAAAKQMEKLADRLDKGDVKPAEREKMAKDLEKAAQALRKQGGQQNEQAAKQLEQAAQNLRQQQQQGNKQGKQGQQNQGGKNQQNPKQGGSQQQPQNGQAKGQAGAASALRQMANGLRQGGSQSGSSQGLRDMLQKIQQSEKDTGENNSGQSGADFKPGDCPGGT